ncbi:MAG: helix-turn-helix transcriptional regulator [Candidatus Eisenbacteria bacterium]
MPRDTPQRSPSRGTLGPHRNSIRRYRLQANQTQAALAAHLGLRWQTISDWERGWQLPTLRDLLHLARALNTLGESLYWEYYAPSAPRPKDPSDLDFSEKEGSRGADNLRRDALAILWRRYGRTTKRQRAIERARFYAAVAREIFDRRTEAGLTHAELGKRIGMPGVAIARLEDDDYPHGGSLSLLLRIGAALDRRLDVGLVPRQPRAVRRRGTRKAAVGRLSRALAQW